MGSPRFPGRAEFQGGPQREGCTILGAMGMREGLLPKDLPGCPWRFSLTRVVGFPGRPCPILPLALLAPHPPKGLTCTQNSPALCGNEDRGLCSGAMPLLQACSWSQLWEIRSFPLSGHPSEPEGVSPVAHTCSLAPAYGAEPSSHTTLPSAMGYPTCGKMEGSFRSSGSHPPALLFSLRPHPCLANADHVSLRAQLLSLSSDTLDPGVPTWPAPRTLRSVPAVGWGRALLLPALGPLGSRKRGRGQNRTIPQHARCPGVSKPGAEVQGRGCTSLPIQALGWGLARSRQILIPATQSAR